MAIKTDKLTKRYRQRLALDGLDLSIPAGVVYGFLGPNAAGKTTTLRLIAGLISPTSGLALVDGYDVRHERLRVQSRIGYLPGEVRLYENLTGDQNLGFLGRLHLSPPSRRSDLCDRFQLSREVLSRKVNTYSRGLVQALGIVAAFQHDPHVYLLDEPSAGLDPLMRAKLVELLKEEAGRGKAVLISSHLISEVECACDRVAMIKGGRLIFEGTLTEVLQGTPRRMEIVFLQPTAVDWSGLKEVVEVKGSLQHHTVFFRGKPGPLLEKLRGFPIEDITIRAASLEEAFLAFFRGEPV